MRIDIRLHTARESPNLRIEPSRQYTPDSLGVLGRNPGETRLDPADTELRQFYRDIKFLIRGKTNTHRLFAIAKRGVVKPNSFVAGKAALNRLERIDLAGPDLILTDLCYCHCLSLH